MDLIQALARFTTGAARVVPSAAAVLLIRHAHTDAVGAWLAGRTIDVALNHRGLCEAQDLSRRLAAVPLAAIYSSPLTRAWQTARAIAQPHGLAVNLDESLVEIDFGQWTGRTFAELKLDPAWRAFNHHRAAATIPDGESPRAVQSRVVCGLASLARRHLHQVVAVVSHADVIRSALLHYSHRSLDQYGEIDVQPASVALLHLTDKGGQLIGDTP